MYDAIGEFAHANKDGENDLDRCEAVFGGFAHHFAGVRVKPLDGSSATIRQWSGHHRHLLMPHHEFRRSLYFVGMPGGIPFSKTSRNSDLPFWKKRALFPASESVPWISAS
jgi:hypothetical protein